jgi:hypothetical protein
MASRGWNIFVTWVPCDDLLPKSGCTFVVPLFAVDFSLQSVFARGWFGYGARLRKRLAPLPRPTPSTNFSQMRSGTCCQRSVRELVIIPATGCKIWTVRRCHRFPHICWQPWISNGLQTGCPSFTNNRAPAYGTGGEKVARGVKDGCRQLRLLLKRVKSQRVDDGLHRLVGIFFHFFSGESRASLNQQLPDLGVRIAARPYLSLRAASVNSRDRLLACFLAAHPVSGAHQNPVFGYQRL